MFEIHSSELKDFKSKERDNKLKILVANDNPYQLLVISSCLRQVSHIGKIDEASNGHEALELVKKTYTEGSDEYYDIIFLDIEMPIMDGFTAGTKILHYLNFQIEQKNLNTADLDYYTNQQAEFVNGLVDYMKQI